MNPEELEKLKALDLPEELIEFIKKVQDTKKEQGVELSAAQILEIIAVERSEALQKLREEQEPNGHEPETHKVPPYYESIEDIGLDLARVNEKDLYSTLVKSILNPKVPILDLNKFELLIFLKNTTGVEIFDTLAFGRAALSRGYMGAGTDQIVDLYRKVGSNKDKKEEQAKNFVARTKKEV